MNYCNAQKIIDHVGRLLIDKSLYHQMSTIQNPYGDGDAIEKILDILLNEDIPKEMKKEFYDL